MFQEIAWTFDQIIYDSSEHLNCLNSFNFSFGTLFRKFHARVYIMYMKTQWFQIIDYLLLFLSNAQRIHVDNALEK